MTVVWSPNWKRIQGVVSTPEVRLQIAVWGIPNYNPRLQTCHHQFAQKNADITFTMLFVSPCELCDFLEPKGLIPGPQGLKRVQDPFPFFLFLFGCAGPCSLTGFSLAVSRGSSLVVV